MKTKSAYYTHPGMKARPYLNPAVKKFVKKWSAIAKKAVGKVNDFDTLHQRLIQARDLLAIAAGAQAQALAPYRTGRLQNSITAKEGIVGTNVKYAPYVEFGVKPHKRKRIVR